jgi:flagellar FliL protein
MSNKLMLILTGVVFLLVAGMGVGLYVVWHKLSVLTAQVAPPVEAPPEEEKPEVAEIGPVVSLDTFIVNLADSGATRYLRVTMDVELDGKEAEQEFARRVPQLRDAILMILPVKRVADVVSNEGKTALRQELIDAANQLMGKGKIVKVYFKEFVVQ